MDLPFGILKRRSFLACSKKGAKCLQPAEIRILLFYFSTFNFVRRCVEFVCLIKRKECSRIKNIWNSWLMKEYTCTKWDKVNLFASKSQLCLTKSEKYILKNKRVWYASFVSTHTHCRRESIMGLFFSGYFHDFGQQLIHKEFEQNNSNTYLSTSLARKPFPSCYVVLCLSQQYHFRLGYYFCNSHLLVVLQLVRFLLVPGP